LTSIFIAIDFELQFGAIFALTRAQEKKLEVAEMSMWQRLLRYETGVSKKDQE